MHNTWQLLAFESPMSRNSFIWDANFISNVSCLTLSWAQNIFFLTWARLALDIKPWVLASPPRLGIPIRWYLPPLPNFLIQWGPEHWTFLVFEIKSKEFSSAVRKRHKTKPELANGDYSASLPMFCTLFYNLQLYMSFQVSGNRSPLYYFK